VGYHNDDKARTSWLSSARGSTACGSDDDDDDDERERDQHHCHGRAGRPRTTGIPAGTLGLRLVAREQHDDNDDDGRRQRSHPPTGRRGTWEEGLRPIHPQRRHPTPTRTFTLRRRTWPILCAHFLPVPEGAIVRGRTSENHPQDRSCRATARPDRHVHPAFGASADGASQQGGRHPQRARPEASLHGGQPRSHPLPVPSRARRPKRPAARSKNAKMIRSGCVEGTARSETARTADARAWQRSPGSVLVLAPDPSGAGLVSVRFGGATGTHGGVILTVPKWRFDDSCAPPSSSCASRSWCGTGRPTTSMCPTAPRAEDPRRGVTVSDREETNHGRACPCGWDAIETITNDEEGWDSDPRPWRKEGSPSTASSSSTALQLTSQEQKGTGGGRWAVPESPLSRLVRPRTRSRVLPSASVPKKVTPLLRNRAGRGVQYERCRSSFTSK
jgi:hypothetical protein